MKRNIDLSRLFSELVRFETELWDRADQRLRDAHTLPLTWFEPMQVIQRTVPCRVNNISEELSITVGGTSKLVDRIEAAGLCQRQPDPADGRSSLIILTEAGEQRLREATQTFERELEECLCSKMSPEALTEFLATLVLLRQQVRERKKGSTS